MKNDYQLIMGLVCLGIAILGYIIGIKYMKW